MTEQTFAPMRFNTLDNELAIDTQTASELVRQHGSPLYVYSKAIIDENISALRAAMPKSLKLHYAIKANPHPKTLQHIATQVDGLDIASAGELSLALQTTITAQNISFAGPAKTDNELTQAIQAGITINCESDHEAQRIVALSERLSISPRVALRINPAFELKTSGMKMGGGAKPFGIDEQTAPDVIRYLTHQGVPVVGLHIFAGSQNLSENAIVEAQSATFALASQLQTHLDKPFEHLNIGGGLGIPYFSGETRLDLNLIGEQLHTLFGQYDALKNTRKIMELGRYIVGESGVYLTQVITRKHSSSETFIICDGGMNHHLAVSGNLGQVLRKNMHVVVANRLASELNETVNIHGPLCTPLDVIAHKTKMPTIHPSDIIGILQSGAYGLSSSPVGFLSHPTPKEILL